MPNFVKILRQIKKVLDSDCSVSMASICYSGPISTVPTNEQLLSEKRRDATFQIDSLKNEVLVCVNTDRRIWLNQLSSSC